MNPYNPWNLSRWNTFLLLGIVLVLIVSACDSNEPTSEEPSEDTLKVYTIEVVQAFDDISLRYPEVQHIALHTYFRHETGEPLNYLVQSKGSSVSAEVRDSTLTVRSVDNAGMSTVIIRAEAPGSEPVELKFGVDVICAVAITEEQASYFPNEVGTQWTYDYFERNAPWSLASSFEITGVLQWEIVDRSEDCGSIQLEMNETFEGIRELFFMGTPDTTIATTWNETRRVRLVGNKLIIPDYTDVGLARLDSLVWIRPAVAPEVVEVDSTVSCGFGGCRVAAYKLERDVGLTFWSSRDGSRSGSLTKWIELRR